jgi:hypothetical protein
VKAGLELAIIACYGVVGVVGCLVAFVKEAAN